MKWLKKVEHLQAVHIRSDGRSDIRKEMIDWPAATIEKKW
jgi:hypothetical protein